MNMNNHKNLEKSVIYNRNYVINLFYNSNNLSIPNQSMQIYH